MTRRQIAFFTFMLALLGAGWGLTQPLTKIAVSTGYGHFGLIFWQLVLGVVVLGPLCAFRRKPLPFTLRHLRLYLVIAIVGTLLANSASYMAAVHLPSGVLSLLLSMVPIFAFPIALSLGLDRFSLRRFAGLLMGLLGVVIILLPSVEFSMNLPVFWVGVALLSGLCYAVEGNYVARWGTEGLDALQVLLGASLVGAVLGLPLALVTDQFIDPRLPLDTAQWALVASSVIHVLVYAGYVWLVGQAGPVFAVQVSYLVTAFGLIWAKLILAEAYAPSLWLALLAMFVGMYLVQPRPKAALAGDTPIGDAAR